MNYKSLIIAVLAGALVATSCMKNLESASVTKVRDAKAEELKSLAELNKAQAAAVTTLANAEASLKLAEAKVQEATAAKIAAEAEIAQIQVEIEKVRLEEERVELQKRLAELEMLKAEQELKLAEVAQAIQDISDQMEYAALLHKKDMAEAYAAMLKAIDVADAQRLESLEHVLENLSTANSVVSQIQKEIVCTEAHILLLENELETPTEYTFDQVNKKRAEIARLKNTVEYLKECLTYDSNTLKNTIAALRIESNRVNDELLFATKQRSDASKEYNKLISVEQPIEAEGEALYGQLKNLASLTKASGVFNGESDGTVTYTKDGEEYVLFTPAHKVEYIDNFDEEHVNVPAEFNTENLVIVFDDLQTANANRKMSKANKLFADYLRVYNKKTLRVNKLLEEEDYFTSAYLVDWYEKQAELAKADLDKAEEAVSEASEVVKSAYEAKVEAAHEYYDIFSSAKNVKQEVKNYAAEFEAFANDVYYPLSDEKSRHSVPTANEALRTAKEDYALQEPVVKAAKDSVDKYVAVLEPVEAKLKEAEAKIKLAEAELEDALDVKSDRYIAWQLDPENTQKKKDYDDADAAATKKDKAVDDAYDAAAKVRTEYAIAKADVAEAEETYNDEAKKLAEYSETLEAAKEEVVLANTIAEEFAAAEVKYNEYDNKLTELNKEIKDELKPIVAAAKEKMNAADEVFVEALTARDILSTDCLSPVKHSYETLSRLMAKYSNKIAKAQEKYDFNQEAIVEVADIIMVLLENESVEYAATFDKLNRLGETYAELDAECEELEKASDSLDKQITELQAYLNGKDVLIVDPYYGSYQITISTGAGSLEGRIKDYEAAIVAREAEIADLLDGVTYEKALAQAKEDLAKLQARLADYQTLIECYEEELAELFGVVVEDSPVQE